MSTQRVRHGISMDLTGDPDLPVLELVSGRFIVPMAAAGPVRCLCGWKCAAPTEPQPQSIAAVYGKVAGLLLEAVLHLDSILPEEIS